MSASEKESSRPPFGTRLLATAAVCILAGLAIRYFLYAAVDVPVNSPPPPRQGLNAPFIITPDVVVEKMAELAEIEEDDVVYDLGCGDGRLVITAVLKTGCRGVGFDIDPERVAEATENVKLHGVEDRVEIVEQDVFTVDLSEADAVLMYLLPWMIEKLIPQFQEMQPGSRIVSHEFWIEQVEPDEIVDLTKEDDERTTIYVYRTPLKVNPALERGKPPCMDDIP